MSERKTEYLELVKPSVGATNWAPAINGNMDKIDTGVSALNKQLSLVQNELGTLGFIYIDPEENYIEINENNIALGTVIDGEFIVKRTLSPTEYQNSIKDYTGWYIHKNYTAQNDQLPPPSNESWDTSDIIVKVSTIQTSGRVPIFRKFPQALGGYYVPRKDLTTLPTIYFDKVLPVDAPKVVDIQIPLLRTKGTINYINFNSPNWTFSTEGTHIKGVFDHDFTIKPDAPPSVDINFFVKNGTEWQRIMIDYGFITTETNTYRIVVNLDSITEEEYKTFIMGYTEFVEEV